VSADRVDQEEKWELEVLQVQLDLVELQEKEVLVEKETAKLQMEREVLKETKAVRVGKVQTAIVVQIPEEMEEMHVQYAWR
jgi:hypothetical protein